MIYEELVNLGLSEKEAKVYLASLALGSAPVQKIAQKAGVNRATTYTNIDALMQLGLMSSFKEGKKFFFYAEAPEKIVYILIKKQQMALEERRENLEKIIPELKAHQSRRHSTPVLRYYKGKEGVFELTKALLKNETDTHYRKIYPYDTFCENFTKKELQILSDERTTRNIFAKVIRITNNNKLVSKKSESINVSPEYLKFKCDISIYGNSVKIVSVQDPISAISVRDPNIADTFKKLYDLFWNITEKKYSLSK